MRDNGFKAIKISDRVYWVGAIDNEIRDFHGYSTSRGTTYNAFLIMGSKPILVDTVKAPFFDEMMSRIRSVIDPEQIAYIISNHAEMDHSGCLLPTIELVKPEKIFASKMGIVALNAHFHDKIAATEINSNEEFSLGDAKFKCIETRMLHWPDSMFTYFVNDKILFSQDGFGMHFATHKIFADQNERYVLRYEAMKYFANILSPYTSFIERLFDAWPKFNLEINILAPDHGPLWRDRGDIDWILGLWRGWARQEATDKVVICYDTMWGSTAKMADAIADGASGGGASVKVMPMSGFHRSDIATELLEAGSLVVGSPTINNQIFPTLADLLCYLKGLKLKDLTGQAFGSFGWSGEATNIIQDNLKEMKVDLVGAPVKARYVPDEACFKSCCALGKDIARGVVK